MAATVDQWRDRVLKEFGRVDNDLFDVCNKCSKGRMRMFCLANKMFICDQNCTPLEEGKEDLKFVDTKMLNMRRLMKNTSSSLEKRKIYYTLR